jgi:hypothetical protein
MKEDFSQNTDNFVKTPKGGKGRFDSVANSWTFVGKPSRRVIRLGVPQSTEWPFVERAPLA